MAQKIVVVSDTHGSKDLLNRVIAESLPFDIIVHCGDGIKDICSAAIPENCAVLIVKGNTDQYSGCDAENILTEEISDKRIMVTHGHQFYVKAGYSEMVRFAEKSGSDIVLFGHTHEPYLRTGNPALFNPGSLTGGSYGVILTSEDGEWIFEHRKLKGA